MASHVRMELSTCLCVAISLQGHLAGRGCNSAWTVNTKPSPASKRGRDSFSLIEALVASCVVAILFVSLYGGISAGFGMINAARENLRATQVMIDKMETLRLYNWSQISSFGTVTSYIPSSFSEPFYPPSTNYSDSSVSTSGAGHGFTYYGTVAVTTAGFAENYAGSVVQFKITLKWTNGIAHSNGMSTYIGQYGIQNYIY